MVLKLFLLGICLVYEDEEHVGPILVLPRKKSGFIPKEDVPPVISKMGSSTFYGSQWRSGMASKMGIESKKGTLLIVIK